VGDADAAPGEPVSGDAVAPVGLGVTGADDAQPPSSTAAKIAAVPIERAACCLLVVTAPC
jgi:hypothetical protein